MCYMISKVCAHYSLPCKEICIQSRGTIKMSTPVPRNTKYAQAKGYHTINVLSFMQKMMQKLVSRNIRSESLGHVSHNYTNLHTNQGSQ